MYDGVMSKVFPECQQRLCSRWFSEHLDRRRKNILNSRHRDITYGRANMKRYNGCIRSHSTIVRNTLAGWAHVRGVSGTWKDLTDNVNAHGREPARFSCATCRKVATAIANGDLTQKITVDVKGEILQIKDVYQQDGRSAELVRGRGDARREGSRHRGQARRSGRGEGGVAAPGRISPTT